MNQEFSNTRKDKCSKSSKTKPIIQESQDLNAVFQIKDNNMNLKIKKSGKTGPALQKKVNTGMETLEDLLKNTNQNSVEKEPVNQFSQNNQPNFDNDEDQLKLLLEKSILQKRILDNHTAEKQAQIQIQGSFEAYDVAASISEGKIYKEIDNRYLIKCVVEWKQRPNGIQPTKSCYDNIELRKHCSQLLLDFYESKIISKEEIDKLQEKKIKEVNNTVQPTQKYEFEEQVMIDRANNQGIQKKKIIEQMSQNEMKKLETEKNQEETQLEKQKKLLMDIMNQQDQSQENKSPQKLDSIMNMIKIQSEQQKNLLKKKEEVSESEKQKKKLLELMNRQEANMNNQIEISSSNNSHPLTDTNESESLEQNLRINSQISSEKIVESHCQMDLES